jgi:hypothetical protein
MCYNRYMITRTGAWEKFYEANNIHATRNDDKPQFFNNKPKPETVQRERVQRRYEGRRNQCLACFQAKPCLCDC